MRQPRGRARPSGEEPAFGRPSGNFPRSPNELLEPARAPEPPRRRVYRGEPRRPSGLLRFLNASFTLMLMLMLVVAGVFIYLRHQYDRAGPLSTSTVLVIPPGDGVNAIAQRLEREGIITDSRLFVGSVYYFSAVKKLKAGEYEIRKSASMRQVLDTLVEGKSILAKVTVPEGLTSYQIVRLLNGAPDLTGEITAVPPEGTLLPDTYRFSRNTDRNDLIARMQADHRKFVEALWPARSQGLPFKTIEEAMIMASIVEKETGRANERDRVAGVFINRLVKGMRLQSDPTIIYAVTNGQGGLGRGIRRSEIDAKNAYNTYQIDGMPPTPICNPGRAAIEAVLDPAATKDLYFVADGSGGHAFAESIRDHQNNVLRWRKVEREARAKQKAAAVTAAAANATVTTVATVEPAEETSAGPGVALDDDLPGVTVEGGETAAEAATAASVVAATAEGVPLPQRKPKNK